MRPKPHFLHARIGAVTHQVSLFLEDSRWLMVACEMADHATPPRHYPVPAWAKLTRRGIDCMACIALSTLG